MRTYAELQKSNPPKDYHSPDIQRKINQAAKQGRKDRQRAIELHPFNQLLALFGVAGIPFLRANL